MARTARKDAVTNDPCQERVAVLGGGTGGLTAAFELTRPEHDGRYAVTVYQLGWRLGGKGASGRDRTRSDRIEEHGLHMWFGFYRNAFRMMREVYEQVDRKKWKSDFMAVGDAFTPCNQIVLWDLAGTDWKPVPVWSPPKPGNPWDADRDPVTSFWGIAQSVLEGAKAKFASPADPVPMGEPPMPLDASASLETAEAQASEFKSKRPSDVNPQELAGFLDSLEAAQTQMLFGWKGEKFIREHPRLRFAFTAVDLLKTTAKGLYEDDVFHNGLDSINHWDLIKWLDHHDAHELSIDVNDFGKCSPGVRAIYDVAFLFEGGDEGQPNAAAGTAINDLLRLLARYRGSLYYKMNAGMGDAIFAPLYQVLSDEKRKVRFRFFSAVSALHVDPLGGRIESIDVIPQAKLTKDAYDPLFERHDMWCWPSQPDWKQLAEKEEAEGRFETEPDPLNHAADTQTLVRGKDFDHVVLAIPPAALKDIARELMDAQPRFRAMVENAKHVATQAFQVWTNQESAALGSHNRSTNVSATYVEPLDTYCDMSHLVKRESWGGTVKSIAYVCGVMRDPPKGTHPPTADAARAEAEANARKFIDNDLGVLWSGLPKGRKGVPEPASVIVDRYYRANVAPWERYVTTPADSVRHRLPSGQSGFENLVLAGDWTKNGIDGGCVEAAVLSGIQAARAITDPASGGQTDDPGDKWLEAPEAPRVKAGLPDYIEHGLTTSSGGPFSCRDVEMRVYVLKGDECRIRRLIDGTLNKVAGPGRYEPLMGDHVFLMMGTNLVSSQTPPWDTWGVVEETLASFWIPLKSDGELRMFISHILVNNPISLYAGRELYGFAKALGRFTPENGLRRAGGDLGPIHVEAFGGNFGKGIRAGWCPLLDVTPVPHVGLTVTEESVRLDPLGPIFEQLAELLLQRTITHVFLKQFRDAADHRKACYQAVIESKSRLESVPRPGKNFHRAWDIEIHPLQTHPITREIGVESQRTSATYEVKFSFDVLPGVEVAPR